MLEIFHRLQRGIVGLDIRAADAILDDAAVVIALVAVGEGIVHAHIGEAAHEDQRLGLVAAQQDVEIGADEARNSGAS